MAERLYNEDGGYYCGECGYFHDDYYDSKLLSHCPECGAELKECNKSVDREYRLYIDNDFCNEDEYPKWLIDLRKQYERW